MPEVQPKKEQQMTWRLYERKWFFGSDKPILFQTEYAIISPENIVSSYRIIAPLGNYSFAVEREGITDLKGQTLEFIKQFDGWKKSAKKVSQENLARGYLRFE